MRIAVFAKAPVAGSVKTRLAAELGPEGAARLHAVLAQRAIATAIEADLGTVELWCSPDVRHPFFASCAERFGVGLRVQSGADLGARMEHAVEDAIAHHSPIVIIGSDCPALDASMLRAAASALRGHEAVFVPAEDGGYVLAGLAKRIPGLFEGIEWGSAGVMHATRKRLVHARSRWLELDPLWDVDRPEDYARMRREGLALETDR